MYSINGAYPVSKFPYQLFDSNGNSRTSLSEDSARRFGCIKVDSPPDYNINTHRLNWDSVNHWEVISLDSDAILHNQRGEWKQVRIKRDSMIEDVEKDILKYQSEVRRGVSTTYDLTKMDNYVESLRQIPQTQTDPFNITWPTDPRFPEDSAGSTGGN